MLVDIDIDINDNNNTSTRIVTERAPADAGYRMQRCQQTLRRSSNYCKLEFSLQEISKYIQVWLFEYRVVQVASSRDGSPTLGF